ncbi:hypothetical protein HYW55_01110 [Candidatus Gottesmanbacteria bacterium]|nr:hypothetical protein [Candidatus Gottesmanbacteria bacterium]
MPAESIAQSIPTSLPPQVQRAAQYSVDVTGVPGPVTRLNEPGVFRGILEKNDFLRGKAIDFGQQMVEMYRRDIFRDETKKEKIAAENITVTTGKNGREVITQLYDAKNQPVRTRRTVFDKDGNFSRLRTTEKGKIVREVFRIRIRNPHTNTFEMGYIVRSYGQEGSRDVRAQEEYSSKGKILSRKASTTETIRGKKCTTNEKTEEFDEAGEAVARNEAIFRTFDEDGFETDELIRGEDRANGTSFDTTMRINQIDKHSRTEEAVRMEYGDLKREKPIRRVETTRSTDNHGLEVYWAKRVYEISDDTKEPQGSKGRLTEDRRVRTFYGPDRRPMRATVYDGDTVVEKWRYLPVSDTESNLEIQFIKESVTHRYVPRGNDDPFSPETAQRGESPKWKLSQISIHDAPELVAQVDGITEPPPQPAAPEVTS